MDLGVAYTGGIFFVKNLGVSCRWFFVFGLYRKNILKNI